MNDGPRYLLARRDGHLLAGSTVEDVGFRNETTEEGLAELIRFAQELLPGFSTKCACLRALVLVAPDDGRQSALPGSDPWSGQCVSGSRTFPQWYPSRAGDCQASDTMDAGETPDLSLRPFAIAR